MYLSHQNNLSYIKMLTDLYDIITDPHANKVGEIPAGPDCVKNIGSKGG